jgi:protein-S-isoprenylcysteine O-methyltransferase Ste14
MTRFKRNLTILLKALFPAVCAVVIFGFTTWELRKLDPYIPFGLPPLTVAGLALMLAGASLAFVCFALFARGGMLTPGANFPDPQVFVCSGPYRHVRNPMAVGGLATLAGWGLFLGSISISLFVVLMAALMHAIVVFVEEPRLERRFGQNYLEYKRRVHRWVP